MLTLMLMAGMRAYIVDVKGASLIGEFDNGEELYCKIHKGFDINMMSIKYTGN